MSVRAEGVKRFLESRGIRPSFAHIFTPKSGGWWIDVRPHGYIYSDKGVRFRCKEDAQSTAGDILSGVLSGRRVVDVIAPYKPKLRGVGIEKTEPQEDWKEENKRRMVIGAKRRAAKTGIEFAISTEDIFIPGVCPVLRVPLRASPQGTGRNDNAPSIDRIIPHLGYVPGNIIVISWRANHLKGNATPSELRLIAEWMDYLEALPPEPISADSGLTPADRTDAK